MTDENETDNKKDNFEEMFENQAVSEGDEPEPEFIDDEDDGEENSDSSEESVKEQWIDAREKIGEVFKHFGIGIIVILSGFAKIPVWIGAGILSKIPKRDAVYKNMIVAGYEGLQDNTKAQFVVNTIYGDGEMKPRKGRLDAEENRIETDNGEWWTAEGGIQSFRIGNANVVTGIVDQHELTDPIAARIAEAVDLSPRRYQPVQETNEGIAPIEYDGPLANESVSNNQTVSADGGNGVEQMIKAYQQDPDRAIELFWETVDREARRKASEYNPLQKQSTFSDIWIDARNPEPENDGWIVSLRKAYDLHWDRGATEEMEKQEDRGRLAEADPEEGRSDLRVVLYVMAAFAMGLLGPSVASAIAGGGDGGGMAISLFVSWLEVIS